MSLTSFISFLLFILILISGLRKNADFLSPGRIFGLVWTAAIGLTDLKFSRLQFEWTFFGWVMLCLGLVFFLLGVYVSFVQNVNNDLLSIHKVRTSIREIGLDQKKLFNIILIVFILYSICYFIEYKVEGYVPLFSNQPDKARISFGLFGLHLVVNSINAIIFFIFQYFILVKAHKQQKIVLSIILLIAVGTFFLLLQRYNLFIVCMMIISLFYYSGRKVGWKNILIAVVIVVALVISVRSLRTAQFAELYLYSLSEMKFPIKYAIFTEPYMYITMNLENFVHAFPMIESHSYGMFSADFITALFGIKHWLGEYSGLIKITNYIAGYNCFPFYWAYYYDFGVFGLSIIPFLLGFYISKIYYNLRITPNLVNLTLYTVGFSVIIISYSSDPLTRLDMVVNYLIIVIAQKYIVSKSQI
jgi:oligosaccharide repeat unit polymerase